MSLSICKAKINEGIQELLPQLIKDKRECKQQHRPEKGGSMRKRHKII